MTLLYQYIRAYNEKLRSELELDAVINDFFTSLDCTVLPEIKDGGKYLLLTVYHRNVDEHDLIEYAIKFGEKLDMNFTSFIKEVDYWFEDNEHIDTQINEYRILYERK